MSAEDWTEERVSKLKTLWMQGLSCSQIARQLGGGITRNAVIGKRMRMGLPDRCQPNRTYIRKPKPVRIPRPKTASVPRVPKIKAEPTQTLRGPPERGPNAVMFIERKPNQCAMFCAGEDGPEGFVCGEPIALNSWCLPCAKLCYQPLEKAGKRAA